MPGLPPFGPGLAPRRDLFGRLRDTVMAKLVHGVVNRNLPALNSIRAREGLPPLSHMTDLGRTAPRILYYTAEPFEYACPARPPSVVPLGPCFWDPPSDPPTWLARVTKPLVLVTCSTEFQDDGRLVDVALEALAQEDVFLVVTTAAVDPARLTPARLRAAVAGARACRAGAERIADAFRAAGGAAEAADALESLVDGGSLRSLQCGA